MYQKEIIYLNLLCHDQKEKNAGFCKIEKKQGTYQLDLQIKNIGNRNNGTFPIRIQTPHGWKEIDILTVDTGCGRWEKSVNKEVYCIEILLSDTYKIVGQSKFAPEPQHVLERTPETFVQCEPNSQEQSETESLVQYVSESQEQTEAESQMRYAPENLVQCTPKKPVKAATVPLASEKKKQKEVPLYEDKWEQLLMSYEKIHPYGDERTYIKLEPKDFIVLRSNYQHLVNNSFLLHGFYNYRYLILGKEKDFYIGVPGVFYEREKMVALMFGFEAFECEGGIAEEGKFGYYLRKVEL